MLCALFYSLELPLQQCWLKVPLQSCSRSKQCVPIRTSLIRLEPIKPQKMNLTFRKCSGKVEKYRPWRVVRPWSPSCQCSQGQCKSIKEWVSGTCIPITLLLSLNPWLSLKAPLSGLWKPAAVGFPIRAPRRGKVNFTKGVTEVWNINIQWSMGQLSAPFHYKHSSEGTSEVQH